MKKSEVLELLERPTSEYRAKPFWSWNGKLDKDKLLEQVELMHEMGFGGFFMHSRTGLETEYLGEEWFDCIRACALRAKELGMEAWLYDEDRWPSGTCGGEVTKDRKNRMRFLSLYDTDEEALACPQTAGILYRYAVRLEKDEKGDERLTDYYEVSNVSEVKAGYRYAVFAEEEQAPEDFYNGYTYIDTMNRDVTELFIQSTHEKYLKYCGDLFGDVIKGIFTDEPHRGPLFNGFSLANKNRLRMAPYTAKLPEAYKAKYGKELAVPKLYWREKGRDYNETAAEYIDVADDLFTQNFARPCREWCEAHGLKLTGHILHEDNLSIQTSVTGSCMRYYEYMDYPGIDVLGEHADIYWAAKQCSSAARQQGKKFVLSELYGATGWDMTFNRYKATGDWQALFGINLRCPHLSWYTMKGEAKRDYPASILHQNAWCKEWKYVEDYFSRLGVLSAEGTRICDTLAIVPLGEMWGKVRMGWMNDFCPNDKAVSGLDEKYIADFRALTERNIDFDYGDEEAMRKYGSVGREKDGAYLKLGEVKYREVYTPAGCRLTEETRRLLKEFVSVGGKVTEDISSLTPSFCVRTPKGTAYAAYELAGDIWLFVLNLNKKQSVSGKIELPKELSGYLAEKWDFREGKRKGRISCKEKDGKEYISVSLVGGEEYILRFTKDDSAEAEEMKYPVLKLSEEFSYKLTEPNVLPLDSAVWETDGVLRDGGREKDVLLIDREIRHEKGEHLRGGAMLQPWYIKKYAGAEAAERKKLCDLKLVFSFETEVVPKQAYLAKEDGSLTCFVNGEKLGEACGLHWVDDCFKVYPVSLKKGRNEVVLSGEFVANDGLEAVYLLGDFGVELPKRIVALPEKLKRGDISPQGMPYYTGGIEYRTGIASGNYTLSFGELHGAVMKVRGREREKTVAFAPYETQVCLKEELILELIFARRNTFGPLHQPYPQGCYGPDSFLTQGKDRVDFVPVPQGLY